MLLGVQTGAFFHALIFFNNDFIPSLIEIFGFQLISDLIVVISAKDLSGSPGLFGKKIFFPPIIFAISFVFIYLNGFGEYFEIWRAIFSKL